MRDVMNERDLLLHWISEHTPATRHKLARACEGLRLRFARAPMKDHARARARWRARMVGCLVRTGHAEWLPSGVLYVMQPTVLLTAGEAHWYGARTPEHRRRVERRGLRVHVVPQRFAPERWTIDGDETAIRTAARPLGFGVARDRGPALLRGLPALRDVLHAAPSAERAPAEGKWENLSLKSTRRRAWVPASTPPGRDGLWREVSRHPITWFWRQADARDRTLVDAGHIEAAKWEAARPYAGLTHDPAKDVLVLTAPLSLPVLVDRALRMASGRCPEFDVSGRRIYPCVDRLRACEVARILGVDLADARGNRSDHD